MQVLNQAVNKVMKDRRSPGSRSNDAQVKMDGAAMGAKGRFKFHGRFWGNRRGYTVTDFLILMELEG